MTYNYNVSPHKSNLTGILPNELYGSKKKSHFCSTESATLGMEKDAGLILWVGANPTDVSDSMSVHITNHKEAFLYLASFVIVLLVIIFKGKWLFWSFVKCVR